MLRYTLKLLLFLLSANCLFCQLPVKAVNDVKYLGGGIADTFKGNIEGKSYALKPLERIGDSFFGNNLGQGNAEAELVSLAILEKLGFIVPRAFVFRPAPQAPSVLAVQWVDEKLVGAEPSIAGFFLHNASIDTVSIPSFAKMFAADVLIKNPDRHGRNYFIYQGKDWLYRPIPIDHNLALEPDVVSGFVQTLSLRDFTSLTRFSGKLATLPQWSEVLCEQVDDISATLDPKHIDEIVEALPNSFKEERKQHIRQLLKIRLSSLPQMTRVWQEQWKPLPEGIKLPGFLQHIFPTDPQSAASLCALLFSIVTRDSDTAKSVSTYLNHNLSPLPFDITEALANGLDEMSVYLQVDKEQLLAKVQNKVENLFAGLCAGQSLLAKKKGISETKAKNIVWSVYFKAKYSSQMSPQHFYTLLMDEGEKEKAEFGSLTALRTAYVICREFSKKDQAYIRDLHILRRLLQAQWQNVLSKAEETKVNLLAQRMLHSRFGKFMRKLYPSINKEHVKEALVQALANFEKDEFYVRGNKVEPRVFAFVLRQMCVCSGAKLTWEAFWQSIVLFGDFSENGPWLCGWEGPYTLADNSISSDFMQHQGVAPHSCARILFERFSWGPYGDWRGLLRRTSPADTEGLLINQVSPSVPSVLHLHKSKSYSTVTVPGGSFKVKSEQGEMILSVEINGLFPLEVLRFPLVTIDEADHVGALSELQKIKLRKLGLEEGDAIPIWLARAN